MVVGFFRWWAGGGGGSGGRWWGLRGCAGFAASLSRVSGRGDTPADQLAVVAGAEVLDRPADLAERRGEALHQPGDLARFGRPFLRRLPVGVAGRDQVEQLG